MYDLRISPFFSVNGRLRPCIFDLGTDGKASTTDVLFDFYVQLCRMVEGKEIMMQSYEKAEVTSWHFARLFPINIASKYNLMFF